MQSGRQEDDKAKTNSTNTATFFQPKPEEPSGTISTMSLSMGSGMGIDVATGRPVVGAIEISPGISIGGIRL